MLFHYFLSPETESQFRTNLKYSRSDDHLELLNSSVAASLRNTILVLKNLVLRRSPSIDLSDQSHQLVNLYTDVLFKTDLPKYQFHKSIKINNSFAIFLIFLWFGLFSSFTTPLLKTSEKWIGDHSGVLLRVITSLSHHLDIKWSPFYEPVNLEGSNVK